MKRRLLFLAGLLLMLVFVIYFLLQPEQPLVAFRLMDPPVYAVGSNVMELRMEIVNTSSNKIIDDGFFKLLKGREDQRISWSGPALRLLPGQSYKAEQVVSKDSNDEYAMYFRFTARTKLEERISKKYGTVPIVRIFLPVPKIQEARSEYYRISSLLPTNVASSNR